MELSWESVGIIIFLMGLVVFVLETVRQKRAAQYEEYERLMEEVRRDRNEKLRKERESRIQRSTAPQPIPFKSDPSGPAKLMIEQYMRSQQIPAPPRPAPPPPRPAPELTTSVEDFGASYDWGTDSSSSTYKAPSVGGCDASSE